MQTVLRSQTCWSVTDCFDMFSTPCLQVDTLRNRRRLIVAMCESVCWDCFRQVHHCSPKSGALRRALTYVRQWLMTGKTSNQCLVYLVFHLSWKVSRYSSCFHYFSSAHVVRPCGVIVQHDSASSRVSLASRRGFSTLLGRFLSIE